MVPFFVMMRENIQNTQVTKVCMKTHNRSRPQIASLATTSILFFILIIRLDLKFLFLQQKGAQKIYLENL